MIQNYPSTNDDNHRCLSVAWSRVRGLEILGSRELSNNASNPCDARIWQNSSAFPGAATPIAVFDRSWSIDGTQVVEHYRQCTRRWPSRDIDSTMPVPGIRRKRFVSLLRYVNEKCGARCTHRA